MLLTQKLQHMETTEITRLQNEIARLNSIVDALIAENNLLKREIACQSSMQGNPNGEIACQSSLKGNTNDDTANHSSMKGNTNGRNANHSSMQGNPDSGNALPTSLKGNINNENPNQSSMKGNTDSDIAIHKTMTGNPDSGKALPTSLKGNINVESAIQSFMKGNTTLQEGNTINIKPGMQHRKILAKHLDKILHVRTPKTGKQHTAILLLHFYNSNRGIHGELMKVTGMKLGGLTKQLANLKKRGWLVRSGWQQFALTDAARKMVEEGCRGN